MSLRLFITLHELNGALHQHVWLSKHSTFFIIIDFSVLHDICQETGRRTAMEFASTTTSQNDSCYYIPQSREAAYGCNNEISDLPVNLITSNRIKIIAIWDTYTFSDDCANVSLRLRCANP